MRPKPPPKYRILVMMATNMPEALDEAMLRPGRIDRIYKVGYPSKDGRKRTYEGSSTRSSTSSPTRRSTSSPRSPRTRPAPRIKDMVNEALIIAIRDGREVITWRGRIKAKQLKELGPPEDVEYIERERHAVAVHEALPRGRRLPRRASTCRSTWPRSRRAAATSAWSARSRPRTSSPSGAREYETDIMVSLASLAGERHVLRAATARRACPATWSRPPRWPR